jgi:nucleoside-diphosphate-sugar epimerase
MARDDDVVVLGGTGFIGRPLVQMLQGRVRSITVVGRGLVDHDDAGAGLRYRRGDLGDLDSARRVIAGASVVYDVTLPRTPGEEFPESCMRCAGNLAKLAQEHSVRRLFYTSSSDAVYLGARRSIDERDGTDARPHLRNSYSRSKAAAEKMLFDLHRSQGLPVVVFRPFIVVGRGGRLGHGGAGEWPAVTCCLGWGRGTNALPFVLVEDVAHAMAAALDVPDLEGRAFNLAGDVRPSAREYISLVARRTHRNFRYYPRNLAWLWLQELARQGFRRLAGRTGQRQSYRDMRSKSMQSFVDCSAAKSLLGWKPNGSLERFLAEVIDPYVNVPPGDLRTETRRLG